VIFDQAEYDLRCEWGLHGLLSLSPTSDAVVVVDVLSFSTAVDVALSRGASVLPCLWEADSAAQFAEQKNAQLASPRSQGRYSLSPMSLQEIPAGTALVLPSPNGSALCLNAGNVPAFTACLRNAPVVAAYLARFATSVALIPAGERWSDNTIRPCLEDWVGAGAILSFLAGRRSPEAESAVAAFEHARNDLNRMLSCCGSGKELIERGFQGDVELASEFAISPVVPVLVGDRFVDASSLHHL